MALLSQWSRPVASSSLRVISWPGVAGRIPTLGGEYMRVPGSGCLGQDRGSRAGGSTSCASRVMRWVAMETRPARWGIEATRARLLSGNSLPVTCGRGRAFGRRAVSAPGNTCSCEAAAARAVGGELRTGPTSKRACPGGRGRERSGPTLVLWPVTMAAPAPGITHVSNAPAFP